jgi:hypothetical protein
LWCLKKGVILTRDNVAWCHWNGDTRCSFCHSPESIQQLFLECLYTKFLWRDVHILFGIPSPQSIDDLFNRWSKMASNKHNSLLLTTASALCWVVWITRNEVVFDKCRLKSFLQVLFRGTHWLRQWKKLQWHDDRRDQLILAEQHLETSALYFFGSNGWLSTRHIGLI